MFTHDTPGTLRRLVITSIIYILIALIAGIIAISRNLPAQPLGEGSGTGRPVLQEFLVGNGTAISPGLPWLALQAALTYLVRRKDRLGTVSLVLLALVALLSGIFATTEPMFPKVFSPATFDPLLALVEAGNVTIPIAIAAFAVLEWIRRRRAD